MRVGPLKRASGLSDPDRGMPAGSSASSYPNHLHDRGRNQLHPVLILSGQLDLSAAASFNSNGGKRLCQW